MTDKERLEEIKSRVWKEKCTYAKGDDESREGYSYTLSDYDFEWLIQQAKRVQELEQEKAEKVEYWRKQHRKRCNELEDAYFKIQLIENQLHQSQDKAERYREALEFYADEEHHKEKLISEASCDADGVYISNDEYAPPIIYLDKGEIARKALEGKSRLIKRF